MFILLYSNEKTKPTSVWRSKNLVEGNFHVFVGRKKERTSTSHHTKKAQESGEVGWTCSEHTQRDEMHVNFVDWKHSQLSSKFENSFTHAKSGKRAKREFLVCRWRRTLVVSDLAFNYRHRHLVSFMQMEMQFESSFEWILNSWKSSSRLGWHFWTSSFTFLWTLSFWVLIANQLHSSTEFPGNSLSNFWQWEMWTRRTVGDKKWNSLGL